MPGRRARSCSCTTSVASSSAASIRATRTASAFERCWRAEVMDCAILRAGRHIPLPDGPAVSARRCRVAHSPTTRRLPPNPAARSRRHNCAPLKRQPGGQAVLAEAENVFALAADNPAGHAAAEPGRAHDPLARNSVVGHVPDHPVDRLPALKAFVVQPFGRREQPRVESGSADGAVDSRHLSPHGGEKGCACVLENMPAIGDLERLWQGTRHGAAIVPVAVARHDLDLGPRPRSGLESCRLPVGQKIDDLPPFEVADQRAVPLAASPGPVIDADYGRLTGRRFSFTAEATLDSIFANWQEKPAGERLARDRGIRTCMPVHAHAAVIDPPALRIPRPGPSTATFPSVPP